MTADVDPKLTRWHFETLYEDRPGWLFVGFGSDQFVSKTGKVKHETWNERAWRWPAQADEIIDTIAERSAAGADAYFTPGRSDNPIRDANRGRKQYPVDSLWCDLDGIAHPERVKRLVDGGAWTTSSGTDGNRHLWVPTAESVEPELAADLNRRLAVWLEGDPSPAALNAYLRPAGTLNYKAPTLGQGPATMVTVVREPSPLCWQVSDLDDLLPDAPPPADDLDFGDIEPDDRPVLYSAHSGLSTILDEKVTAGMDRSDRTMAAVGACLRAGMTKGQTIVALAKHRPTVDKYGGGATPRFRKEVSRCIGKAAADIEAKVTAETTRRADLMLPEQFWQARPKLDHIRRAAHSRVCSADLTFHSVMARLSAYTHHCIVLPAIIGSYGSLNYFGIGVAVSGGGKSTAVSASDDLVEAPVDVPELPLGSGEGLAENYMGWVTEANEDTGKGKSVKRQTKHNVFVYVDEGGALNDMMDRKGSTLHEALRRAWTGATLGQSNATQDRTRVVPKLSYRLGLLMGFQPEKLAQLMADDIAGTPQRFLFTVACDPNMPDVDDLPEWPGPLPVRLGSDVYADHPADINGRKVMQVDQSIVDELRRQHVGRARGDITVDSLDAHRPLHLLKTAGLLALLEERMTITTDDWELAGIVWETSCRVRGWILEKVREDAERTETARIVRHAVREHAAEAARGSAHSDVARVARRIAGWLHERNDAGHQPEDGFAMRDVRHRLASKERHLLDPALSHALDSGWVAETDGRYLAGESRPA